MIYILDRMGSGTSRTEYHEYERVRSYLDRICVDVLGVCDMVSFHTLAGLGDAPDTLVVMITLNGMRFNDFEISGLDDDQSTELHGMVNALYKMTREARRAA